MEFVSRRFCKIGIQRSSIPSRRRGFIESHDDWCNSLAAAELFAELAGGIFAGNFADAYTKESAVRRIILLDENRRVGKIQAVAQSLRVGLILERTDLHREKSPSDIHARRENFHAHGHDTRPNRFNLARRRKRKIDNAIVDKRPAIR